MIKKVEIECGYSTVIENDSVGKKTQLGVQDWQLMFNTKKEVEEFITMLQKGLEFWEYE